MKVTFYDNDGEIQEVREDAQFESLTDGELVLSFPDEPIPLCDREEFSYERIVPTPTTGKWLVAGLERGETFWWEVNGEALIGLTPTDSALLDLVVAIKHD